MNLSLSRSEQSGGKKIKNSLQPFSGNQNVYCFFFPIIWRSFFIFFLHIGILLTIDPIEHDGMVPLKKKNYSKKKKKKKKKKSKNWSVTKK